MCRTFFVALLLFSTLVIPSRSEEAASGGSSLPSAASWKTWTISSGQELRLAPPPDSQATLAEIGELRKLADERAADHDRIAFWDAGPPSYRWVEFAVDRIEAGPLKGLCCAAHRVGERGDLRRNGCGVGFEVHVQPASAECGRSVAHHCDSGASYALLPGRARRDRGGCRLRTIVSLPR